MSETDHYLKCYLPKDKQKGQSGDVRKGIRLNDHPSVIYEEIYIHACGERKKKKKGPKNKKSGFHRKDMKWVR